MKNVLLFIIVLLSACHQVVRRPPDQIKRTPKGEQKFALLTAVLPISCINDAAASVELSDGRRIPLAWCADKLTTVGPENNSIVAWVRMCVPTIEECKALNFGGCIRMREGKLVLPNPF